MSVLSPGFKCSPTNILTDCEEKTRAANMSPNRVNVLGLEKAIERELQLKNNMTPDTPQKPFKREIKWRNLTVFVIGHLMGLYGLYYHLVLSSWLEFLALSFIGGYTISTFGLIIGAHRYYTHRCFKASKALQLVMVLCQTAASQNNMWSWVRDHRQHHKYSDTDADPHNASNGFFFSHVGWLLCSKHPDVFAKGKGIDMSDLDSDPIVMFQKRHYTMLWWVFALLLPWTFGALVWGSWWYSFFYWFAFRILYSTHATFLVNSWAHLYGKKPFDKNIGAVEAPFVSFLVWGEGWHNYHHTFPWDYKTSEYGARFNVCARLIRLFARLGWVWDLKEVSDQMIIERAKKTGDGSMVLAAENVHFCDHTKTS